MCLGPTSTPSSRHLKPVLASSSGCGACVIFIVRVLGCVVIAHGLVAHAVAVALGLGSRTLRQIAVIVLGVVGACAVIVVSRVLWVYVWPMSLLSRIFCTYYRLA